MVRKKQSRGRCVFCGREMTRGGLAKHLTSCVIRKEAMSKADQKTGNDQTIYHLQIQDAWDGDFWLHLEMRDSATLKTLDSYLRAIWLECCGHLSQFLFDSYGDHQVGKSRKAGSVFRPGVELLHIYDFGTSSETKIKVVGARQGKALTRHSIYLMARNEPPEVKCCKCDEPAAWLCMDMECQDKETYAPLLLCKKHAKPHKDNEHFLLPILNSPRTGMCGYEGPAEPPY